MQRSTESAATNPPASPSPPIRAVLMDAGNTLVFLDPTRMIELIAGVGVEVTDDAFRRAELEARAVLVQRMGAGSTGTEPEHWQEYFLTLFRLAGVGAGDVPALGARVRDVHDSEHLWTRVEPGTHAALESLRDRGFRLGVISNADGRMEALLETVGLRPAFEFVIDSQVVGVEKPDTRIFHEATTRLGVDPAECLYVGDLFAVDAVGAREAGMRPVLIDPIGQPGLPVDRIPSVGQLPGFVDRISTPL